MTLSTETCIAIAEEVWGWEVKKESPAMQKLVERAFRIEINNG